MITPMQMYWLLKLDDIIMLFSIAAALTAVISIIVAVLFTLSWMDDRPEDVFPVLAVSLVFTAVFACAGTFIPSTKQMAAIYVVPALVNNERVQNIGNKTLDVSEDLLKLTEQYLQAVSIDKR